MSVGRARKKLLRDSFGDVVSRPPWESEATRVRFPALKEPDYCLSANGIAGRGSYVNIRSCA